MAKVGKLTGAALIALMVAGSGAAFAFGKKHGPDFETLDADGDGLVTQAEIEAAGAARFAAMDTDGDGALSLEELKANGRERAAKRADKMMERLDADGDGKLTAKEMPKPRGDRSTKMFEHLDTDGDGAISQAEFEAGREKLRDRMAHRHGQRDGADSN